MHSIIKSRTIVVDERAEQAPLDRGETARGPRVELVRIEGRVVALELTCDCGQAHVVELDYAPEAAVPAAPTQTPAEREVA